MENPTRLLFEKRNEMKPFIEILCLPDEDTNYEECNVVKFTVALEEGR